MKEVAALMYVAVSERRSAGCWTMSVLLNTGQGVSSGNQRIIYIYTLL